MRNYLNNTFLAFPQDQYWSCRKGKNKNLWGVDDLVETRELDYGVENINKDLKQSMAYLLLEMSNNFKYNKIYYMK